MISTEIIVKLNSRNVSINPKETSIRLKDIWKDLNEEDKNQIVIQGGYTDIRSFNKSRTSGLISVRMAITLAQVLNINPFYITAEADSIVECSGENINNFLIKHNFEEYASNNKETSKLIETKIYINKLLEEFDENKINIIDNLSEDEIITLLKSMLVKAKINSDNNLKLFIIKLLLIL